MVRLVAAFQSILQADLTVQAFVQRGAFVGDRLLRSRWREWATQMDSIRGVNRFHPQHGSMKGPLVGVGMLHMDLGRSMPMCGQCRLGSLVPWAVCKVRIACAPESFGRRPRFVQLDAIAGRQRLYIGHCRPESGKVIRVAQPDQAWPRLSR